MMSGLVGFREELIGTGILAADWREAVILTGAPLIERGFARKEYLPAVIEREETSPTGLPTRPIGVAMPHADSEFVRRTGIAVGVLEQPVSFRVMGSPDQGVEVSIVFLIAMKDPENQVLVLQHLCELFQSSDLLEAVRLSREQEEISRLLSRNYGLGGGGRFRLCPAGPAPACRARVQGGWINLRPVSCLESRKVHCPFSRCPTPELL